MLELKFIDGVELRDQLLSQIENARTMLQIADNAQARAFVADRLSLISEIATSYGIDLSNETNNVIRLIKG